MGSAARVQDPKRIFPSKDLYDIVTMQEQKDKDKALSLEKEVP